MTQQAMELGRVLADRYRIEAVLGRGAVGAVYRATDLRTRRPCAIKILHAAVGEDTDAHARFVNEGQVVAQLFHPNIVEMQEFGTAEDGMPFLVMEMLQGPTLLDVVRGAARLPLPRVIDIARQVGSALHAAHSVGIVHRDIKPQNIVLHREAPEAGLAAGKEVVKVVDFGLSRILSARSQHTAPGIIVGTIEYMSPESTTGRRQDIDARTDQWALAVVVYRLLSGKLPYQSPDPVRLLLSIRSDRHVPLAQLVPALPPFVSEAVERALAKDKQDRFESVQDFVRALQGLPLRTSASVRGDSSGLSHTAQPAPVPQATPVEPSAPYAEYRAVARSGERSLDRRGETLSAPALSGHSVRVTETPVPTVATPVRPSRPALDAQHMNQDQAAMSGALSSTAGTLPAQLWLALVGLLLVALSLFALALSQTRPHGSPIRLGAQASTAPASLYLPPLLGSR